MKDAETTINTEVTLRHSRTHKSIKDYAVEAVQIFDKYSKKIRRCHVVLDHQKHTKTQNKIAEITVYSKGKSFHAQFSSPTYEQSLQKCIHAISRQMEKRKKIQSKF